MSMEEFLRSQTARRFFDDFSKLAHAVHQLANPDKPSPADYGRPRYKHVSPESSAFLGQWQNYDLYYMPLKNGTDVYLVRYGDVSNDVCSSQWVTPQQPGSPGGWIIALKVAQFIATELELQQPRTRKAILTGDAT